MPEVDPFKALGLAPTFDLDAARVTLRGETATGGSAPPSGWFSIYRNERDATGAEWRRRLFHAGYSAGAEIVLPAGDYVATLRGDRRRGERAFSVVAGERRLVEIPFAGEGPAAPQTALDARTASAAAPR